MVNAHSPSRSDDDDLLKRVKRLKENKQGKSLDSRLDEYEKLQILEQYINSIVSFLSSIYECRVQAEAKSKGSAAGKPKGIDSIIASHQQQLQNSLSETLQSVVDIDLEGASRQL